MPVGADPEHRASTIEGQIARVADIIAYVNHDIDDAVRAGIAETRRRCRASASRCSGGRRRSGSAAWSPTSSCRRSTGGMTEIRMSDADPAGDRRPAQLPVRGGLRERRRDGGVQEGGRHPRRAVGEGARAARTSSSTAGTIEAEGLDAAARDFLAGMTDRYAVNLYEQLFIPKPWVSMGTRARRSVPTSAADVAVRWSPSARTRPRVIDSEL